MAVNPVLRPPAEKLLFAKLSVVRLTTLVAQSDVLGLNEVNLFPERSREARAVIPVPVKVVSLLFQKVNADMAVFPLTLRVVRLGKSTPVKPVLIPAFVRRLFWR